MRQIRVDRGADHADRDAADGPAEAAVDNAETAPGQPGVDAEHPHTHHPCQPSAANIRSKRYGAGVDDQQTDTPSAPTRRCPRDGHHNTVIGTKNG
jgi:hypothetical protein